jgi:hypothetical protein
MEDGESKTTREKSIYRKSVRKISNVSDVFQSIWIRHCSVPTDITNRKFVESELRFILSIGSIFWVIYFITKIF